jgi:predicted DNA-binding transcriptional regulator AlpA
MSMKRALVYNQLKAEKGIPWTRQYIRRLEKAGRFPHHFNIGPNTIAWFECSIDEFLEQRAAESGVDLDAYAAQQVDPLDVDAVQLPMQPERARRARSGP